MRPQVEALFEPGEQLQGIAAATQPRTFRGRLIGLAVTDWRQILVPLNRKIEADGDLTSILPEEIASEAEGVSGGWWTPTSGIMDKAAVTLRLRTTDGTKRKLMMMRGEGPGVLGKLARCHSPRLRRLPRAPVGFRARWPTSSP